MPPSFLPFFLAFISSPLRLPIALSQSLKFQTVLWPLDDPPLYQFIKLRSPPTGTTKMEIGLSYPLHDNTNNRIPSHQPDGKERAKVSMQTLAVRSIHNQTGDRFGDRVMLRTAMSPPSRFGM